LSYDAETMHPFRAGDLVQVNANSYAFYGGKLNVNETHHIDPAFDFTISLVTSNYGLPTPELLTLSDLKNADDTYIFDQTRATAIFCTAMEGAQGIIRSCHEHRVHVPGDISVCSFGNPEKAMLSIPSITIVDRPDPKPELRAIFELFLGLSGDTDRLMYRPEGYNSLRLGESTGKAPPKPKEFAADVNGKNAPGKFASQGAMRMPLS
jgi:hypothetical protein